MVYHFQLFKNSFHLLLSVEAIVFGRYLRMHENGFWKRWHDAIQSDPGLDDEMYDDFQMKEWKENKK